MFHIDEELREFCESGVAVLVGRVDADGYPRVSYAWGPRVKPDGRGFAVYLETARSDPLLSGLEANPRIAVTFTAPVSARSIQLKGDVTGVAPANEAEEAWVIRHRDAMVAATSLIGDPPQIVGNLFLGGDMLRIEVAVDRAFDQTPGPNAGKPLPVPEVAP